MQELRQNEIIDRLKAFSLTPDPGTVVEVSAGEGRPLVISYSADSLSYGGVHDLPVLVSIKEGRHFWLDLKGTTVPPQSPMLHVPTGLQRSYVLEPVAIGTPLSEAPLQTTELLNVGEAAVSYKVDSSGIKRANNSQGHGMPVRTSWSVVSVKVFRLEEKTGSIAGGGSAFLRWRFLPLEAKEYVLRVTVRTVERQQHDERFGEWFGEGSEEQTLDITLRAAGYDPRMRDPHSEILPAVDLGFVHPARQLEVPSGQPCILGAERLRLGRIPQGAVLSRIISMRNCLLKSAVEFSWDPEDTGVENPLLTAGVVSIQPFKGRIDAAQSVLFQVTIFAGCGPRFLGQQPVACVVCQEPPTKAVRSRRPKSRLESRMDEERQARARAPEPRVPVVSRPTAARSQHVAEIAKTLSTRHSCSDDHGRVLCPAYPTSTVNAPVPRVLAEALEQGTGNGSGMGGELPRDGCYGGEEGEEEEKVDGRGDGGDGARNQPRGAGEGLQPGPGGRGITAAGQANRAPGPALCLANRTGGGTDRFSSRGGDRPGTSGGGAVLLRLDVEGEVVCMETFHALYGGRGEINQDDSGRSEPRAAARSVETSTSSGQGGGSVGDRSSDISSGTNINGGRVDAFVVPGPSRYVPDWAAFGAGHKESGKVKIGGSLARTEKGGNGKVGFRSKDGRYVLVRIP
ncbi:unnamed protein product [Ectocarpus sp. CCAP 1310/34]|nr:unnamed protein product [Ectocarpus sp. CCAP 1310/34]